MMPPRPLPFVLAAAAVGCSRPPGDLPKEDRTRLAMTATAPALAPSAVPQPPLREIIDYLARNGVVREDVAVFSLSSWLMYRRRMEDEDPMRPRYESTTFDYDGSKIALRVGPTTEPWQVPAPASQDMIVRNRGKDPAVADGATLLLEGQEWAIGYSMTGFNAEREKRLTALLLGFAEDYLRASRPAASHSSASLIVPHAARR